MAALMLLLPAVAAAETALSGASKEPVPIVVTAKTLLADNKNRVVVYKTGVVVTRGDLTLYADEVTIRFTGPGPGGDTSDKTFSGPGKIRTIEAAGGVKIVQDDKTATADKAVYNAATDEIVLTGKPRLWQGPNVLTGSSIAFNIAEDTVEVQDARTVLYQDKALPITTGEPPR
jgi:lipopolysaccharide export system protein LptA